MKRKKISKSEKLRKKLLTLKHSKDFSNHSRLCDEVLLCLHNPKKIAGYSTKHYDRGWVKNQEFRRQFAVRELTEVPKFQVSNELLKNVLKESYSNPSTLLSSFYESCPSYKKMWIEWNEKERVIENDRIINNGAKNYDLSLCPDKVGYLLETHSDPKLGRQVVFSQFTSMLSTEADNRLGKDKRLKNHLIIVPYAFLLHLDDDLIFDLNSTVKMYEAEGYSKNYINEWKSGDKKRMAESYKTGQSDLLSTLLGDNYASVHNQKPLPTRRVFRNLSKRVQRFSHALSSLLYAQHEMESLQIDKNHNEHFGTYHNLFNGDGRFIWTLLSMLNSSNKITSNLVNKNSQLEYSKQALRVPKSEYKLLDISLPNTNYLSVPNPNAQGVEKRFHQRRGHWRTYQNGKKVWIQDKWVGNEQLGTIYHDYNLKTKIG